MAEIDVAASVGPPCAGCKVGVVGDGVATGVGVGAGVGAGVGTGVGVGVGVGLGDEPFPNVLADAVFEGTDISMPPPATVLT